MDRPDYKVCGERPLQFFKGTAIGSVSKSFIYGSEEGAQAMKLLDPTQSSNNKKDLGCAYVNGGPFFQLDDPNDPNVKILACYEDLSAAVVDCKVGNGRAILSGPHLEVFSDHIHDLIDNSQPTSSEKNHLESMLSLLIETDQKRLDFLTRIFELLELEVNKPVSPDDSTIYPIWITSLDSNDSLYIKDRLISDAKSHDGNLQIFVKSENAELDGKLPIRFCESFKTFPEFSIAKFQKYLGSFNYPSLKPIFGSTLLYAQRIGSTQTTIEK
jgi:biotin--protein ligase